MELFTIHKYLSAIIVNVIFYKLFCNLIKWMVGFIHLLFNKQI